MSRLETWYNNIGKTWKSIIRNVIIVTILTALFQVGNNARKDYLIVEKEEIITKLTIELKQKDIELEKARQQNLKLQIELVKCQNNYNLIQSSLDDIPLPAWIYDTNTKQIVYLNKAYEDKVLKRMGLTKFDLIGRHLSEVFNEKTISSFNRLNKYVFDTGNDITEIENQYYKDKVIKWRSTKYPIYQFGKRRYVGGIAYEIEND